MVDGVAVLIAWEAEPSDGASARDLLLDRGARRPRAAPRLGDDPPDADSCDLPENLLHTATLATRPRTAPSVYAGIMSFAKRQRAALTDLLDELGPFAPTQCEGWQTQDLAAHLYVREHKLGALPGIGLERFAEKTEQIQNRALHSMDYPTLVEEIRTPGWIMRPLDGLVNTSEFFIHHEDVLRANGRSQTLTAKEQQELWPLVQVMARRVQAKAGDQLRLTRTDKGEEKQIGTGERTIHLSGLPSELLLHLTGRDSDVELVADPPVLDNWLRSLLSL